MKSWLSVYFIHYSHTSCHAHIVIFTPQSQITSIQMAHNCVDHSTATNSRPCHCPNVVVLSVPCPLVSHLLNLQNKITDIDKLFPWQQEGYKAVTVTVYLWIRLQDMVDYQGKQNGLLWCFIRLSCLLDYEGVKYIAKSFEYWNVHAYIHILAFDAL